MSSIRERQQRAAARAKLEQEMTARSEAAQKRRRLQSGIGAAIALVLVLGLGTWGAFALFGGKKKPAASTATCEWIKDDPKANEHLKDVGMPPTSGEPREGTRPMTITTTKGEIDVELDLAGAPCTSASMTYLAGKNFFDGSKCHRLVPEGIFVLQCGDPSGTGSGGPAYKFAEENLPEGKDITYPAGTIAMAKTDAPNTTGSQFFIVYKDDAATTLPAQYTVVGKVTKGLDIVQKVAAGGLADDKTAPKDPISITTLRVGPVAPAVSPTASPSPSPSASAKP